MRLLLDEMFSPAIAHALRARGHDAEAIQERPEWHALSDAEVIARARREQRAVVTNNLSDYRPLHAESVVPGGPGHAGLVFGPTEFRHTRDDVGRMVAALEVQLSLYPGERDLANAETWLS